MKINLTDTFGVDAQLVMTGRGCIIGQSGSGKSYLVGTIAEKLSSFGLPYCIIDTEGEYSTLKESHFGAIAVGGDNQDFGFDTDLTELFSHSIKDSVPVLLDISDERDKSGTVYRALEEIYKIEEKLRLPYLVLIEEADKFAPQVVHKKMNIIEEIGVRGRKRGIGLIVATQRPSNISKNLLSQCSYGFIGKLTIGNDLKSIRQLFDNKRKLDEIVKLAMGEFVPFGLGSEEKIKMDMKDISRKGSTPLVGNIKAKADGSVQLEELIDRLKSNRRPHRDSKAGNGKRILSLALKFSNHDAHGFAMKVARKRFGVIGPAIERPESIKLRYITAGLCKIRTPTKRKNEFEEYCFLISRNFKLIKLSNGVAFRNGGVAKAVKLSELESKVLGEIRQRRKLALAKIDKVGLGNPKEVNSAISKLVSHKLVTKDKKNLYAEDYKGYLLKENPKMEMVKAPHDHTAADSRFDKESVRGYVGNLYPAATLVSMYTVHIPVHEIILRYKNKVRIFKIDGVYGKEITT